jgi:ubiquinone/menaquinone biosynthesis C-methylase UbiE
MKYYDEIADGYDELHREEQLVKHRVLKGLLLIEPNDTILDLGHGSGLIGEVFDNQILGIDTSRALLDRSKARTELLDFNEPLPFDDASFDWVVSFTALHHAHNPERLIAEARRIARRGVVMSILRSLDSYERLASLFEGWDAYEAGADTLYVFVAQTDRA